MFRSLVREHHWSPGVLGDLFFDAEDYEGVFFWYSDLKKVTDEVEAKLNLKK